MKKLATTIALCAFVALPTACNKNNEPDSTTPEDAAESEVDPLVELQAIPEQIQAEVDTVLQPINDIDVVVDQLTSLPTKHGFDAASLAGLAKASFDGGEVSVDLDVTAEAKAEIEALLETITGIVVGIKELPQRSTGAAKNIVALGAKSTELAAGLQAKYQAKLANPLLKADKKAKMQADLQAVIQVNGDIKATVSDARATVMGVPAQGSKALSKLTAALAGKG